MDDFPILFTNDLILQGPSLLIVEDLIEIYGHRETMSMFGLRTLDKFQVEDLVKTKIKGFQEFTELYFTIYHKKFKKTIGIIDLHYREECWQIEFITNIKFRRRGYIKQALVELLLFCRKNQIITIMAKVKATNQASIILLENFGFKKDGISFFFDDKKTELGLVYVMNLA